MGFLIHFCQFVSSVNRTDTLLLIVHLLLSSCFLFLASTRSAGSIRAVASRQCLSNAGTQYFSGKMCGCSEVLLYGVQYGKLKELQVVVTMESVAAAVGTV